ncbi:FAD-binding oxidoreductase [Chloroflexota bacterium]
MKNKYGRVTRQTIEELKAIAGENSVITASELLEEYSRDEMPLAKPHSPKVTVKPADSHTVAALLDFASIKRIPVTPVGARTGLTGGCIPVYGGIALSLERMNRIIEIDRDNFAAVVQPGVTLSELYDQVEQQGLYYPLYPGESTATVGGTIATNAGGINAVKYGVTRHNVLGLEAVLPEGKIIRTGGKFVKCSTGYDLTQLITGSEGTLAVITEAILKLTTKPAKKEVLFVPFTNIQDAIDTVPEILKLERTPAGIEFLEKDIIEITEKYLGREIPYHEHAAFLMVIVEGKSEQEIYEHFSQIEKICRQHGAAEVSVPGSTRAGRRLLEARGNFYHALKAYAPMEVLDIVVPRNRIGEFVRKVKEISKEHRVPVIVYGHAGDGNVHLHPVCRNMGREDWDRIVPALTRDLYSTGVSFGGAISGEHGIGLAKKAYFNSEMADPLLEIMKNIKKAFDPNNILNPGKIFDL